MISEVRLITRNLCPQSRPGESRVKRDQHLANNTPVQVRGPLPVPLHHDKNTLLMSYSKCPKSCNNASWWYSQHGISLLYSGRGADVYSVYSWINSLTPRICRCNLNLVIFKLLSRILSISSETALRVNETRPHRWLVNIGSGNGLVLSGNKPLPEPVLTQSDVIIWCHFFYATLSQLLICVANLVMLDS